jgi:hypothetical protein
MKDAPGLARKEKRAANKESKEGKAGHGLNTVFLFCVSTSLNRCSITRVVTY